MPVGEELARFQRGGLLSNPLPAYKPGFLDYLIGNSLWWVIGHRHRLVLVPAPKRNGGSRGASAVMKDFRDRTVTEKLIP